MLKELLRTVTGGDRGTDSGTGSERVLGAPEYGSDDGRRDGVETDLPDHLRFLPPEDRVLTLLEHHGGRMWQQDVADELDLSVGRVSQLLVEMEADGEITRYWKESSKVVVLPDPGPGAALG